jgi:pimeloyl-ACP methyl ester carboxylesterase
MPISRLLLAAAVFGGSIRQLAAQGAPMTHAETVANGVRLHYVHGGSGPLILFLHGFPEFWYAWKDQLAEFASDHHAVAPDLRGFNLSEKPTGVEDYRAAVLIEDIRALAARLNGGKPFVLVGHDWGGALAWGFAIKYPDLVRKLVIINAPHPGVFDRELTSNPAQQKASQYMLFFRSERAESVLAADRYAALRRIFDGLRRQGRFTDADEQAYLDAWSQPGALTGGLNYYRAARVGPPAGEPASPEAPAPMSQSIGTPYLVVRCPTLVIWGERDDALLTGNLDGLDRYVSHLTIERIPEGSHWVVHEFPERINAVIRGFLTAP